jgi:hypothetical protein
MTTRDYEAERDLVAGLREVMRELAELREMVVTLAGALADAEGSGEVGPLSGPLGVCPPLDGGEPSSVTALIDVPAAIAEQRRTGQVPDAGGPARLEVVR